MSTCKTSAIASTTSPYVESSKKRRRQSVQISAMLQSVNSIAATPIRLSARADGGLLSPTPAKDIMTLQSHNSNVNKSIISRSSTSSSSFDVLEKKLKSKSTDVQRLNLNLKDASKKDINDIFKAHFSSSEHGEPNLIFNYNIYVSNIIKYITIVSILNKYYFDFFLNFLSENCDDQPYLVPLQTPSAEYSRTSSGFVAVLSPEV